MQIPLTCTLRSSSRLGFIERRTLVDPPRGVQPAADGPHAAQDGVNVAWYKIVNLLKTLWDFFVITYCNVFNVWPKTTLLPVWPRNAKRLDTPDYLCANILMSETKSLRALTSGSQHWSSGCLSELGSRHVSFNSLYAFPLNLLAIQLKSAN